MFVLRHFIEAVASVIDLVLGFYMWVLIVRAVVSWVNPDPYNPLVRILYGITDPLMYRVRRFLPLVFGSIDLTPMVLIIVIVFLRGFLVPTLYDLAIHLY
ncbi:MAG: YggT family protein [Dissulfurimicrobium sp.]|uniref:YggT family protein n=1 Tax=Dissulfurimicrobium TaxID=1769732 RepID=UPI001EDAB15C|nr:YggT family protein [Dissulfurimicrobium hydrothermale]UKL13641.1 YggT family protein [Dissulfurimicrobium hydrothermale]